MAIKGRGWFTYLFSGGNFGKIPSCVKPALTVDWVDTVLACASEFARRTRKGWFLLHHPHLGQMEWKRGLDFRTGSPYLFVKLNGRTIINGWPKRSYEKDWMKQVSVLDLRNETLGIEEKYDAEKIERDRRLAMAPYICGHCQYGERDRENVLHCRRGDISCPRTPEEMGIVVL